MKNKLKKLLLKYKPRNNILFSRTKFWENLFINKKKKNLSNFIIGCKNFLKVLKKYKISSKFINFSSCEIYGDYKKKINIESKKKPISCYGLAKLKAHNETKKYREKYNLKRIL